MHFFLCPKQGNKIEGVVLNRVCILGFYLSLTGSWFQTLSGSPIPKYLSSTPPGGGGGEQVWGGKQVFKPGRSSFHVDMISFHFYCIHSLGRVIPRYRNNSNAVILVFSTVPIQTCYPSKSMTDTSVIFKGRYKPCSPGFGIARMNKRRGRESLEREKGISALISQLFNCGVIQGNSGPWNSRKCLLFGLHF